MSLRPCLSHAAALSLTLDVTWKGFATSNLSLIVETILKSKRFSAAQVKLTPYRTHLKVPAGYSDACAYFCVGTFYSRVNQCRVCPPVKTCI